MRSLNRYSGLNRVGSKLINQLDKFDKLKEIANRKNYPHKVKLLHSKIKEEYDLWSRKEPSAKLSDLKRDLLFIESQILNQTNFNKERIDLLINKYGYGKGNI